MIGFKQFLSSRDFTISRPIDTSANVKTFCTNAPENSDSAENRSKIREEKILAYTKVREFSPTCDFTISHPLDDFSYGRSMVEMLGVLAIIGVLSVGGIAGYSKAMEQYRLLKQKQLVVDVINSIITNKHVFAKYKPSKPSDPSYEEFITQLFYSLGYLPEEYFTNNNTRIKDNLNGIYTMFIGHNINENNIDISLQYYSINDHLTTKSCTNILSTAYNAIDFISTVGVAGIIGTNKRDIWIGNKTFRNYKLINIQNVCSNYCKEKCEIHLNFNILR